MRIVCDLDGVLADIITPLRERIEKAYGVDIQERALDKFDLTETLREHSIPSSFLWKCYQDPWFWAHARPYSPNIERVNLWMEQNHEIHIVTGRKAENVAIPTVAWVKKHGIKHTDLKFWPVMKKYEYMLQNDCQLIIEDRFFEANKAASYGFDSFVVRRPYNVEYEDRVTNPFVRFIDQLSDIDSFVGSYRGYEL